MDINEIFIDEASHNKPINIEFTDGKPPTGSGSGDEFLQAMTKSSNRRKILVRFKFKNADMEYQQWLTFKQYEVFRTINCLEFCRVVV